MVNGKILVPANVDGVIFINRLFDMNNYGGSSLMGRDFFHKGLIYKWGSYLKNDLKYFPHILTGMVFRRFPIENKKVVIGFPNERESKMVTDALLFDSIEYDIVWVTDIIDNVPEKVRVVPKYSLKEVYELSTSRIWVDNSRKKAWAKKRKEQIYVQTWHGAVGLKSVEQNALKGLTPYYIRSAKNDSKNIDYFVAETEWQKKQLKDTYWYEGAVIEAEFKDKCSGNRTDICKKLGISDDKKIVLYVPTFRKDNDISCYNLDYNDLLNNLEKCRKGEWIAAIRLHPNIANKATLIKYTDKIINCTRYYPLIDLISVADIIISDYSSCLFYGFKLNKEVHIYASDIEHYLKEEREFMFDLYNLPSPVAKTNEELTNNILNFDINKYKAKSRELFDEIGYYEKDAATEVTNIIHDAVLKNCK